MSNLKVLRTYIKKNKNHDNSFWEVVGEATIRDYLTDFSAYDWDELISGLKYWPSDELIIIAVALTELHLEPNLTDTNALYGFIFTLVENSEADYLIQHLDILDDGRSKSTSLINQIRNRIGTLETYTSKIHNVHDYSYYYDLMNTLVKESQIQGNCT